MRRYLFDRDGRTERVDTYSRGRWRRRWPRSRAGGCLMWLLLLVLLMIVLSVMFGGFQKGTKDNGLGYRANVITAVAATGEAVAATGEAVAATGEAAGSARGTSG